MVRLLMLLFFKSQRTRISVKCIERVVPNEAIPMFIRVEHKQPTPGELVSKAANTVWMTKEDGA